MTRDYLIRVPAGTKVEDLPKVIAAGLKVQYRGSNKPPLYVAKVITRRSP